MPWAVGQTKVRPKMNLSLISSTIRLKTLPASIVPVVVMHAYAGSKETLWITFCALFSAIFIQIGTNLFNDLKDHETGVDTENRVGPTRALHKGMISPKQQKILSHLSFIAALLLGIPLVVHGGIPIIVIGLVSIFLGYAYSMEPLNLSRNGTAEIFVITFFGLIPCATLDWLHQGVVTSKSILLGLIFGLIATSLLAINNLRDLETDRASGRKTIAVRFGEAIARFEVLVTFVTALVILCLGFPTIFHILWVPIAVAVSLQILKGAKGAVLNLCLALTGLVQMLTGISLLGYFYG